ncbi:hypothetical protein ACQP2U_10505 [Nocardia sp. CA-084685]
MSFRLAAYAVCIEKGQVLLACPWSPPPVIVRSERANAVKPAKTPSTRIS